MASEAKTAIVINGRDNTAKAFGSVAARASACAGQLRGVLGGALAAAGTYLGFSAILGTINDLGHLSDIAQKANMSVDDLTKATTAFDIVGIQNMGIDQFAKAMDYLQKTTGRIGMEGFYQTIEELAKIEDRAMRGQEAMRIFGRSGMEFMPLINGAEKGTRALRELIDVMPGISHAAANSGDNVADAMGLASREMYSLWGRAIGAVCRMFDEQFSGGVQQSVLKACAYLEYFAKVSFTVVSNVFKNLGSLHEGLVESLGVMFETMYNRGFGTVLKDMWGTTWEDWKNGDIFGKAFGEEYRDLLDERGIGEGMKLDLGLDQISVFEDALQTRLDKISRFSQNLNNAATGANESQRGENDALDAASAVRSAAVRNALIMAGSNAAAKLSAFGPTYQSETKKQTKLLEKIATNTATAKADAANIETIE